MRPAAGRAVAPAFAPNSLRLAGEPESMQILYVPYRFPFPPDKGERIRAFGQIRSLDRLAEVHVLCPVFGAIDRRDVERLAEHCASVEVVRDSERAARARQVRRFAGGRPALSGAFDSPALRRAVQAAIAERNSGAGVEPLRRRGR